MADSYRGKLIRLATTGLLAVVGLVALISLAKVSLFEPDLPPPLTEPQAAEYVEQDEFGRNENPEAPAIPLVVFPFTPISNGPDDAYFADAVTLQLIDALSRATQLRVTGRQSAFQLRGSSPSPEAMARRLGAEHWVTGSVSRAGERLQLEAGLHHAGDATPLWSGSYSGQASEVFELLADISGSTLRTLDPGLTEDQGARMRAMMTGNVRAIIEHQKGLELFDRAQREGNPISLLRRANVHFRSAIELEARYPDAYRHHAELYWQTLFINAAGQVDGNLSVSDISAAPPALFRDLGNASIAAKSWADRQRIRFDTGLAEGSWDDLVSRVPAIHQLPDCTVARWSHLVSAPFGFAGEQYITYQNAVACHPYRADTRRHLSYAALWLADWNGASSVSQVFPGALQDAGIVKARALALGASGRLQEALTTVRESGLDEAAQWSIQARLSALGGDGEHAGQLLELFLGKYGPDDFQSLVIEAMRGNRSEANRLAARIDARPLGHMVLLDAIYECLCGMPFELESTPNFSSLLAASDLPWPPRTPIAFPLKNW